MYNTNLDLNARPSRKRIEDFMTEQINIYSRETYGVLNFASTYTHRLVGTSAYARIHTHETEEGEIDVY